ncbi:ATP-binding protein [Candidatus Woesearchaeota archaeon]|nr:ATP-binding protein [Candidatus Woesearchaeota archaeon]
MAVDASDQIEKFQEFLESHYKKELYKLQSQDKKFLVIDFAELSKFDPDLAEQLLEEPTETIRACEVATEQFGVGNLRARFTNLAASQKVEIRNIRSTHLDKFIFFEGIIRQSSNVRPQVVSAKFECPSCGNAIRIPQLDETFREPSRCTCGRKGKFRLLSKELVDAQRLVIEESSEDGGAQPKRLSVFLREDLVEPRMEKKTIPGSKVRVVGIIKEIPIPLKSGGTSVRFDLAMIANFIELVEEDFSEIEIDEEDEKAIKQLAGGKDAFQKLTNSIAPSIFGHERIKQTILLQLLGGVRKKKPDGTTIRGDIHVLLVGDPGCIVGDSRVALLHKGMNEIQSLGKTHLQPIKEVVTKIRKNQNDKPYDFATVFHKYLKQPVLKLVTETGKEITCTYNQPFLTKYGWERADEILPGTNIRVMPKIPNLVKYLAPTNFIAVEKKAGCLKKVSIPDKLTPELASLYGYIIGDGHVHTNGYRIACYVNNEETDLIPKLSEFWKNTFAVEPVITTRDGGMEVKTIDNGNGLLRQIISTQQMHIMEINSRQVASSLSFLANKRVPGQIFKSPNRVIAKFVSWLFEADGCAFATGRGRTSVQLKSRSSGLLKDVQLLLLYFGIQSRIIEDNLCIRRSRDMKLFAEHIGFNSEKKKNALGNVLREIKIKCDANKRKHPQRYEKVKDVIPCGVMDVFDFEVPISHSFIANGIVCHNSAKSSMLMFTSKAAPKARYVAGRSTSGAGITASLVKDEFMRGWALEAGAIVLANKGIMLLDEMDKMSVEDTSALHEAMENQQVSIAKANVQATLKAETSVLAAANPKLGRFDPYAPIAQQINLPPALINRFDMIFIVKDKPNKIEDEKIATHVLNIQRSVDHVKSPVDPQLLRKFICYVKQKVFPVLTEEAMEEIKNFYVELRNSGTVGDEAALKPVPITARQLEGLVRLAEASARVTLSDKVTKEDARRAIEMLRSALEQVGIDPATGKIDIDRISTGISTSERGKIIRIRGIINDFDSKGRKTIPVEEIVSEASKVGISEEKVHEAINQLKRGGDIFEPKRGFIQKL